MSREDVEIVRRIWEAWERRDSDAALAVYQLRDGGVVRVVSYRREEEAFEAAGLG